MKKKTREKLQYKVLCIGVNRVPVQGFHELNYAEKDAQTAAKYFATLKNKAEVTLYTGEKATRGNILDWVKQCGKTREELKIIIFFAGHGSAQEDESKKRLERCLWIDSNPGAEPGAHQLKTSEILNLLKNPLHKLIFLIDACYNFDPKQEVSIQDIFKQFKESERMIALKQYAIISASAVNQVALEDPRLGHGVLAYYFLQTMAGKYTFLLSKRIAFFKLLVILDRKVRNHRFLTDTGRKHPLKMLKENGIMVHWHDKDFDLPVLEPIPLIENPDKNAFQKKLSQWAHFFKRTRLRRKIFFMSGILAAALMLLTLAHLSMVRIHFQYKGPQSMPQNPLYSKSFLQYTIFHNFFFGPSGLYLSKMESERLGQDSEKTFTLYLFKHNWAAAFIRRLDEKGKIILLGNYLGEPIRGVDDNQIVNFALQNYNRNDMFYWHPRDVKKLLKLIQKEYKNLYYDRKKIALQILAELGEHGKTAAVNIFDFKKEKDQELRDLFLKHFYSPGFWERNFVDFNLYDYLCLINYDKSVPFPNTGKSGENTEKFLSSLVQSLPGAGTRITGINKLAEIYGKLKILAYLGSPYFQKKTAVILKIAFDADHVLDLILICKDFNDRVWLLDQYFKRMQNTDITWTHWCKLTYDLFKKISAKEKSKIIKFLINTKYRLLPEAYRKDLFWDLRDTDPGIIGLSHWENWMQKYPESRYPGLIALIKLESPRIFPFIETHYHYFKGNLSEYLFDDLYKKNNEKTIQLVKNLYAVSTPKDKLCCAIFLYSKNYREYSTYIGNFVRKAKNHKQTQEILTYFYQSVTNALIRMVETNEISKDELRFHMNDRELFFAFAELNLRLWPEEVKNILLAAKIPHDYNQGIPLLRACEKLSEPYREKMLIKIIKATIDETFKVNTECSLIKNYPGTFLKLAYKKRYHYQWEKRGRLVEAYCRYSYEELRRELIFDFRFGYYGPIGFIMEALIKKQEKGELNIQQLRQILQEFNQPVERMLLRDLRYYLHKRYFQESPANDRNIPQCQQNREAFNDPAI
jgi:hypothetical protein